MAAEANYDVLIVGAGVCGATAAYFLSGEGLTTGLLDQGHAGREASWASEGMIGPRSSPPRDPWFLQATTTSRQRYDRLAVELPEQTGTHFGYGGEGTLDHAEPTAQRECGSTPRRRQTSNRHTDPETSRRRRRFR